MQTENNQRPSCDRVIRVAEQIRLMDIRRTQFYELAKNPNFPPEITLGNRARGLWLSETIAYIDSCKRRVPTANDEQALTSGHHPIGAATNGRS